MIPRIFGFSFETWLSPDECLERIENDLYITDGRYRHWYTLKPTILDEGKFRIQLRRGPWRAVVKGEVLDTDGITLIRGYVSNGLLLNFSLPVLTFFVCAIPAGAFSEGDYNSALGGFFTVLLLFILGYVRTALLFRRLLLDALKVAVSAKRKPLSDKPKRG